MDMSCCNPFKILRCPVAVLAGMALLSLLALAAAFISEGFLGLEPCILCVYQRWPYAVVMFLGIAGVALRRRPYVTKTMLGLSGLAFLVNSGIAFYHTGVEQKWWRSAVEGCMVPAFGDEPQSLLDNILSAPTARCDEIPWQDPVIGLSMANYNVIVCFGLFVLCALCLWLSRRAHKGEACHDA